MSARPARSLLAEFHRADQLVEAARRARAELHYARIEAYSPFPIEELSAVLPRTRRRIAPLMLLGAAISGSGLYFVEWYSATIAYPINVGGRPLDSWPAFVFPAIELTILGAVVFGALALLFSCRLPRVYHPLFGVPAFERASSDRFFLLLPGSDPAFDEPRARELLAALSPVSISDVWE